MARPFHATSLLCAPVAALLTGICTVSYTSEQEGKPRRSRRSVHLLSLSRNLILLRVFILRKLVRPSPDRHGPAELELRHILSSSQELNIEWESVFVPVYWRMASCSLLLVQTSACGRRRGLRMEYTSRPAVRRSGLLPLSMLCSPPDLVFYFLCQYIEQKKNMNLN